LDGELNAPTRKIVHHLGAAGLGEAAERHPIRDMQVKVIKDGEPLNGVQPVSALLDGLVFCDLAYLVCTISGLTKKLRGKSLHSGYTLVVVSAVPAKGFDSWHSRCN
jgi:hypothetical protein